MDNYHRHFRDQVEVEGEAFRESDLATVRAIPCPVFEVDEEELNSVAVSDFVESCRPDLVMTFGVGWIKDPVYSRLPRHSINLHLGLSPWYRGNATLFWPFYNLEPQCAGSTFHIIADKVDAGPIISQLVPDLKEGDGIHDVAARVVKSSSEMALRIIDWFKAKGDLPVVAQPSSGRLYRSADLHPTHLRVIYDCFDNRIVDFFLDGVFLQRTPRIISF